MRPARVFHPDQAWSIFRNCETAKKWRRFSTAMPNTSRKKSLSVKTRRHDLIIVAMKFFKML
jgi:hypothetical protein